MRKINTDLPEWIFNSTISSLINLIDEEKVDTEINWTSFGGSTTAGQNFIDYLNTREPKTNANVTGMAASMGAFALPFFDSVRGSKQSDVMIHRVSGGASSTHKHTNQFFYDAMAKKIDLAKFKDITGVDLKMVMLDESNEGMDIWLTGKEAGEIGLFNETYDLLDKAASLPIDLKELNYKLPDHIKEKYGLKNETQIIKDMEIKDVTVDKLASGNVDVYNSVLGKGKKAETERVNKVLKYAQYDMKKAQEIINNGEELSIEDVEYFMEKKHNKVAVAELEGSNDSDFEAAKTTKDKSGKEATKEEKEKEAGFGRLQEMTGSNIETEKK